MTLIWRIVTFPLTWWWRLGKKRWFIIPLFIVFWIAYSIIMSKVNAGKPDFKKYEFYSVTEKVIKKKISREGKLFQQGVVPVVQPTSGLVTKVLFKNGSVVKKGQTIAVVDSTATQQQKSIAWQKYLEAKNAVSNAEIKRLTSQNSLEESRKAILDASQASKNMQIAIEQSIRSYTLEEKESILSSEKSARKSFEIAEENNKTIDTVISAAKASLSAAWWEYQSLTSATIVAPADGVVSNLVASQGDYISLKEDEPFASIVSNAGWIVRLSLYEKEAQLVKSGNAATIQMLLKPDQVYHGTVDRVDTQGTLQKDGKETTFNMVVSVTDPVVDAVSGSRVTVDVLFPEKTAPIAIPNAAIRYREGKRYVQLYKNGKAQDQLIEVGMSDAQHSEVISGLAVGDQILTFRTK
jgi:RND family efflux transporter MFP subunit